MPAPPITEDALRDAHTSLTRILGAIEEYVYTGEFLADGGYVVLFAGPCREQFLGLPVEEAATAHWRDFVHPGDVVLFDDAHDQAHLSGRLDVQYRMVGGDGVTRWVRDRGRMRREDGRTFLDGSILDVSEIHAVQEALVAARAEAERLAHVDHLTGVANRRSLPELFEGSAGRALGLLSIDIDRFKDINDQHGHAAGDAVLVIVAERLRASLRERDAVVRMGGEEFLLLVRDVADLERLAAIGDSVCRAVESEPVPVAGELRDVTVSVGAAWSSAADEDREAALIAADRALYAAKRAGRNRVRTPSAP